MLLLFTFLLVPSTGIVSSLLLTGFLRIPRSLENFVRGCASRGGSKSNGSSFAGGSFGGCHRAGSFASFGCTGLRTSRFMGAGLDTNGVTTTSVSFPSEESMGEDIVSGRDRVDHGYVLRRGFDRRG